MSGQQHAPDALYPRERRGTHFTGGWVGPRAGLDGRKISSPQGFDPGPSSPQSVAIPTELPGPLYIYIAWGFRVTFYYRNATMHSICIVVDLHVPVNNIKPLCCHGNARMRALCTVIEQQYISYCCQQYNCISVFMQSARYCCPILTKSGIFRHIFAEVPNIKFHEYSPSGSRADNCAEIDRRTDMTKLIGAFPYLRESTG